MFRGRIGEALIEQFFERFVKILDEYGAISAIESDIRNAENSVLIFSPFVDIRLPSTKKILNEIKDAVSRGVNVKIVVKPNIHPKALKELKDTNAEVYARDTHAKAVIIDEYKVLYLGSLNVLASYGKEDIMIRVSGLTGRSIIPKILSKKLYEELRAPTAEERI